MEVKTIIDGMVEEMRRVEGNSMEFTMNNMQRTKGLTGVVAVYEGTKPAHLVVEELYAWAKENDEDLRKRIEAIEQDMSWNEENPV